VLAASIATGIPAANVLQSEVLWRLPIAVRIGMLEDLLERHGLTDRWPFIIPVLRSFFDLRNTLAHGLTFTGLTPDGPTPDGVTITTLKRGRGVTVSYPMERLEWLAWQARVVDEELFQLWTTIVPVTKAWHEPSLRTGTPSTERRQGRDHFPVVHSDLATSTRSSPRIRLPRRCFCSPGREPAVTQPSRGNVCGNEIPSNQGTPRDQRGALGCHSALESAMTP
jgi:hypothetical protein